MCPASKEEEGEEQHDSRNLADMLCALIPTWSWSIRAYFCRISRQKLFPPVCPASKYFFWQRFITAYMHGGCKKTLTKNAIFAGIYLGICVFNTYVYLYGRRNLCLYITCKSVKPWINERKNINFVTQTHTRCSYLPWYFNRVLHMSSSMHMCTLHF